MNKVTVTLQNPLNKADTLDYYIYANDSELGELWFAALRDILQRNLYLEKNFCFLGFPDSQRNLPYLCKELASAVNQINSFFDPADYHISEVFTEETMRKGLDANQDTMNILHNHFEHLQGTVWGLSDWYKRADYETKFAIRQLNNICHEAESLMLSQRKKVEEPDWVRPSQITTFLNSPRYDFPNHLKRAFVETAYDRKFGEVYLHWTQIGKTYYEVFRDERGAPLDAVTCDAITNLRYYSGEFDIEWAQDVVYSKKHMWYTHEIDAYRSWLEDNNIGLGDRDINYGYHPVAQVALQESFGTTDFKQIWTILSDYLDIQRICVDGPSGVLCAVYPYVYTDPDYAQQQIERLKPGYDYSSKR